MSDREYNYNYQTHPSGAQRTYDTTQAVVSKGNEIARDINTLTGFPSSTTAAILGICMAYAVYKVVKAGLSQFGGRAFGRVAFGLAIAAGGFAGFKMHDAHLESRGEIVSSQKPNGAPIQYKISEDLPATIPNTGSLLDIEGVERVGGARGAMTRAAQPTTASRATQISQPSQQPEIRRHQQQIAMPR